MPAFLLSLVTRDGAEYKHVIQESTNNVMETDISYARSPSLLFKEKKSQLYDCASAFMFL